MRWLSLCIILLFLAHPLRAGPWTRDQGDGFASSATQMNWPRDALDESAAQLVDVYDSIYLEYGLTKRLTVGLEWGRAVSGSRKLVVFSQVPLRDPAKPPVMSLQFGLGRISDEHVLRPGLGIGWPLKNGWLSVDSVVEFAPRTKDTDLKIDITLGRRLPKDRMVLLQLQTGDSDTDPPFVRLAPSFVSASKRGFRSEFGASWSIVGPKTVGLKMGLWKDF